VVINDRFEQAVADLLAIVRMSAATRLAATRPKWRASRGIAG
jgi:hypothetical protein